MERPEATRAFLKGFLKEIPKGNILKYWTELSIYLLGENVTKKDRIINGISISPKIMFYKKN